jgi:hypothetical protein
MIKKFVDEYQNTFVFIKVESEGILMMWLNGVCQYTFTLIEDIPKTLEEANRISGLNIWYPMDSII